MYTHILTYLFYVVHQAYWILALATQVQHLVRETKKTRNAKLPWLKEMKAAWGTRVVMGTLKGLDSGFCT